MAETLQLVAHIVSAYVEKNSLRAAELPALIGSVNTAIAGLGTPAESEAPKLTPAVSIKKSVTPDYIICLECGVKQKTLRRHLRTSHGLRPDDYRAKWGLEPNYPIVAANYAATRSELAKAHGFGKKPAPEPAKRGRGKQ